MMRSHSLPVILVVLLSLLAGTGTAFAADAATVTSDVRDDGISLEPGVDISSSEATSLVNAARNQGSRFYLVVLRDEPTGGPVAFSEAVFDRLDVPDGSVVTLTPVSVGWVTQDDVFVDSDFQRALNAANDAGGDDAGFLRAFVSSLTGSEVPVPSGSGGSGGGSGFLWFVLIVGLLVVGVWWVVRRGAKADRARASDRITAARGKVQEQIDAVANDVLDLAEEVRLANNPEADRYYEAASATYTDVSDRFPQATDATSLLELSGRLDEAIWQLDATEAVLDGNPVPPKPERPTLQPEPAPTTAPTTPVPAPRAPSYPTYQRRPSRRSSYVGPGLFDILIGVGSVIASSRGSRRRSSRSGGGLLGGGGLFGSRSGSGGGLFGGSRRSSGTVRAPRSSRSRSSGSSRSRSSGRSRGGGSRRR